MVTELLYLDVEAKPLVIVGQVLVFQGTGVVVVLIPLEAHNSKLAVDFVLVNTILSVISTRHPQLWVPLPRLAISEPPLTPGDVLRAHEVTGRGQAAVKMTNLQ